MGLRLSDVKELLTSGTAGPAPTSTRPEVAQRRLADVAAELARLQTMKRDLVTLVQRNQACADLSAPDWWRAHTTDSEGR